MSDGYRWVFTPGYTPIFPVADDKNNGDNGVRFVDINGDKLPDMVWAISGEKGAAINTGCGWKQEDDSSPPYNIVTSKGDDRGVRFVRLNDDKAVGIVKYCDGCQSSTKGAKFGKKMKKCSR